MKQMFLESMYMLCLPSRHFWCAVLFLNNNQPKQTKPNPYRTFSNSAGKQQPPMHRSQNCDTTKSLTVLWDIRMFEYVS